VHYSVQLFEISREHLHASTDDVADTKSTINPSEPLNLKKQKGPKTGPPYPKDLSPYSVWLFIAGNTGEPAAGSGPVESRCWQGIRSARRARS